MSFYPGALYGHICVCVLLRSPQMLLYLSCAEGTEQVASKKIMARGTWDVKSGAVVLDTFAIWWALPSWDCWEGGCCGCLEGWLWFCKHLFVYQMVVSLRSRVPSMNSWLPLACTNVYFSLCPF